MHEAAMLYQKSSDWESIWFHNF